MDRFYKPSRISVGKVCRRRIPDVRNPSRRRKSATANNDNGNRMVDADDGNEQKDDETSTHRIGKYFKIFDICDRSEDSPNLYKVRWKGYKDRKYDTYEPASYLRHLGFERTLSEVDEYVKWRKEYLKKNPDKRQVPNIYRYRRTKGVPVYTANESFTCVSVALNVMCNILKVNFLFDSTIINKFNGNNGFLYSKMRKMIDYQRKMLKTNFLSLEGIKNNRVKGRNDTRKYWKTCRRKQACI